MLMKSLIFPCMCLLLFLFPFAQAKANNSRGIPKSVKPLGADKFKDFLELLEDPANKVAAGLQAFEELAPDPGQAVLGGGETYLLYRADINNDAEDELILAVLEKDKGGAFKVKSVMKESQGMLIDLGFERTLRRNLVVSRDLGSPFLLKKGAKVYLNLKEGGRNRMYFWQGRRISPVK